MPTLNEKMIRAEPAPSQGRTLITDSHQEAPKGFALKVLPSGKKTFVLRYNANGRDRLVSIGEFPTWSLAAARKRAGEIRRDVDKGTDVLEERRKKRAEPTVADVVDRYLKARVDRLATGRATRKMIEKHLPPAFLREKISAVSRADVIELVEELAEDHPRQAGKLFAYIKQIWNYAEDREILEANRIASLKPSDVADGMSARTRSRTLSDDEIKALWSDDLDMRRPALLALRLILVTGQRPGEVIGMRRSEIEGSTWTIPKGRRKKTDTAQVVPLTQTALDILEQAEGTDFVFEAVRGGPLDGAELCKVVRDYAEALRNRQTDEEGRWRPHDLRRTVRTRLAELGFTDVVAEQVMGHTRKGIAATYDTHGYLPEKKRALERWERRLLAIVSGEPEDREADAGNVVAFPR